MRVARRRFWAESLPDKELLCPEQFLLSSYVLRPSGGTDRKGTERTPGVFPEIEAITYSPKK